MWNLAIRMALIAGFNRPVFQTILGGKKAVFQEQRRRSTHTHEHTHTHTTQEQLQSHLFNPLNTELNPICQ